MNRSLARSLGVYVSCVVLGSTACNRELTPTSEVSIPGLAASAGGGPTTNMTEEGCLLHPEICHPDDDPPLQHPQVGHVEEVGPIDYSIRSAPGIIDPSPGAPGVYLGFSDSTCYTRVQRFQQQDSDQDGLTDYCEYQLARAFAPMLNNSEDAECFGGEPYWAAKYFDDYWSPAAPIHTGDFVRIAYMPAYYQDCGTWQFGYFAHSGDSELIQVTVGYYDVTQHWELFNGFLSAHTCTDDSNCASQFSGAPSQTFPDRDAFQYPGGRQYTYPRVYISHHKHANYNTKSNCDNGGALWGSVELCNDHDRGRFKVWESHNIGNIRYPLVDCTPSQRSGADPNVEECFWSDQNFDGWNARRWGERPPGYIKLLHSFAYACKWLGPGASWCSRYGL